MGVYGSPSEIAFSADVRGSSSMNFQKVSSLFARSSLVILLATSSRSYWYRSAPLHFSQTVRTLSGG